MFREPFAPLTAAAFALILGSPPHAHAAADGLFRLEDHVAADFHRRYLSVEPYLDWNQDRNEDGPRIDKRVSDADGTHAKLRLTYGSERFSQALSWKLSNGIGLGWNGEENTSRYRSLSSFGPYWTGSVQEGSGFDYTLFSRLYAQWYATDGIFLSPWVTADIHHAPSLISERRGWQISDSFQNDSLEFLGTRGDIRAGQFHFDFKARLAFGYGRIQDVRFAETALFLLDKLSGTLGRTIAFDSGTMRELEARLESRRKLRPFYDARMAAIYDMESVLEFLHEKRPDDPISHRAVLEMADEWNYAGRHERKSGWEIRAFPFFGYSWDDSETRYRRTSYSIRAPKDPLPDEAALETAALASKGPDTVEGERAYHGSTTLGAGLSAAYHRPWRRFYQFDVSAYSHLGIAENEHGANPLGNYSTGFDWNRKYISYGYPSLDLGYTASVSWYPSTRTTVTGYLQGNCVRKWDYLDGNSGLPMLDSADFHQFYIGYGQSLGVFADYFLGPRLVFKVGIDERSDWYRSRDEIIGAPWQFGTTGELRRSWYTRRFAHAGLTYYLF